MRKTLALVMALSMVAVVGCRGDDNNNNPTPDGSVGQEGGGPTPDLGQLTTSTIPEIKTGKVSDGQGVKLEGVIITAVDSFGDYANHAYVQDPAGGKNSGLFLFGPNVDGGQLTDLKPGDVVDVAGVVQYYAGPSSNPYKDNKVVIQLKQAVITKKSTGTEPTPVVVTPADLKTDPDATAYEGVLIKLENVKVRKGLDKFGEFEVDGGLEVDDDLYAHSTVAVGDCMSIVGIPAFFYVHKLNPRGAADIVASTNCAAAAAVAITDIQDPASTNKPTKDTEVKITGVITAVDNNPSATSGNRTGFYMQEEGAGGPYKGIYVFHSWADTDTVKPPAVGTKVEVTGIYTEYFDLSEIKNVTEITDMGAATAIAPITVTAADIQTTGDYQKYEGVLIKVETVKVKELVQSTDKTKTYGFSATDNFEVKNDLFDFTMPAVDDTYTSVTGVLHKYKESAQIMVRSAADLVK
jgi:predicted extracellular nuclease